MNALEALAFSLGFKKLDEFLIFLLFIILFAGFSGFGKLDNFLVFMLFILLFAGPKGFRF
jgi:hypothetical protein